MKDVLLCKFADRPGIVALYVGSYFNRSLEIMTEEEGIKKGTEESAIGQSHRQMLRTQQITFKHLEDFVATVSLAAKDFFGSADDARPFLSSLNSLQPQPAQ